MPAPSVIAVGALGVTPNNAASPMTATGQTLPGGVAVGKFWLCCCTFDTGATVSGQSTSAPGTGWTFITNVGNYALSGGGIMCTLYGKVVAEGDAAPSPTFTGGTTGTNGAVGLVQVIALDNVDLSNWPGTPTSIFAGSSGGNAHSSQNIGTITGFTPTQDNTLQMFLGGKKDDFTTASTPSPTDGLTYTNHIAASSTNSGDASMVVSMAPQATAAVISGKTVTLTGGASSGITGRQFAIKGTADGTAFEESVADSLSLGDAVVMGPGKVISDPLALDDSVGKDIHLALADTLALGDSTSMLPVTALADSMVLDDSVQPSIGKNVTVSDPLTLDDTALTSPSVVIIDVLALADAETRSVTKLNVDSLVFADSVALAPALGLGDTLAVAEELSKLMGLGLSEALAVADTVEAQLNQNGSALSQDINDSLGVEDAINAQVAKSLSDAIGLADEIRQDVSKQVADLVQLTDDLGLQTTYERAIADVLGLGDAVLAGRGVEVYLASVITVADDITGLDLAKVTLLVMTGIMMPFPCPVDGGRMFQLGISPPTRPSGRIVPPAISGGRLMSPGRVWSRCESCSFEMEQAIF